MQVLLLNEVKSGKESAKNLKRFLLHSILPSTYQPRLQHSHIESNAKPIPLSHLDVTLFIACVQLFPFSAHFRPSSPLLSVLCLLFPSLSRSAPSRASPHFYLFQSDAIPFTLITRHQLCWMQIGRNLDEEGGSVLVSPNQNQSITYLPSPHTHFKPLIIFPKLSNKSQVINFTLKSMHYYLNTIDREQTNMYKHR
jgi:hypothetical protein